MPSALSLQVSQQNLCPDLLRISLQCSPPGSDQFGSDQSASQSSFQSTSVRPGSPQSQSPAAATPGAIASHLWTLHVGLHWGHQPFDFLGGKVQLGLSGLSLSLMLENLSKPDPNSPWQVTASSLKSDCHNLQLGSEVQVEPEAQPLTWEVFNPTTKDLQGTLEANLGPVQALPEATIPWPINLVARVGAIDLRLIEAEGLWPHDIHPNHHAVLERSLLLALLQTQIPNPLSQSQLHSQDAPHFLNAPPGDETLTQRFQHLLKHLLSQPSDLLALAQASGFDPRVDFVGANLLAIDGRNLDLSGANLRRANLRGADLTDADLSEANLTYARLSGADCSGTFFSGANLAHANLHRTSLALANLATAQLQGADLREANLSNANFSGASVQGTLFGHNPGMTPELQASLLERGALLDS